MIDTNGRFKKSKDRQKKSPVKRVTLSADAKQGYEALVRERDKREVTYGRHLAADNKPR